MWRSTAGRQEPSSTSVGILGAPSCSGGVTARCIQAQDRGARHVCLKRMQVMQDHIRGVHGPRALAMICDESRL